APPPPLYAPSPWRAGLLEVRPGRPMGRFIGAPLRDSLAGARAWRGIMGNINASVDLRRDGEIAVVTTDNPPVNALKHEVRAGVTEALKQLREDGAVKAVVVVCAGRTFFAGADITEFGKPPQAPSLHEVIAAIE